VAPSSFVRSAALAALLVGSLTAGCRRRAPPAPPAAKVATPPGLPDVRCPAAAELSALLAEAGRSVRTDCTVLAPGFFWAAAALSTDDKGSAPPRLSFVSGGPGLRTISFDVEPPAPDPVARLVASSKALAVRIRVTRSRQHLVRLGVVGRPDDKSPDSDEVALVLQLVAHAPPHLVWVGPGDQTRLASDGCLTERTVEFEMPFRRNIEVFTSSRARPTAGKPCPPAGPGTQESVTARGVPLRPGRAVGKP
jgi:hypothetical protein